MAPDHLWELTDLAAGDLNGCKLGACAQAKCKLAQL